MSDPEAIHVVEEGWRNITGAVDHALDRYGRGDEAPFRALTPLLLEIKQDLSEYWPFIEADDLVQKFPGLKEARHGKRALLLRLSPEAFQGVHALADAHLLTASTVMERLLALGLEEMRSGRASWD